MNSVYHYVRSYMLGRKARLVAKEAHRKTGRLLDIGTGTGYFAATMVRRGWKVAVSYTHLDVYKRQVFDNGLCTFFRALATKVGNTLFGDNDIHGVFAVVDVGNPVSYTHLDVYKRQK